MTPKVRLDFAGYCNELKLTGTAVEIGVAEGGLSRDNLRMWNGELYCMVDLWARYDGYTDLLSNSNDVFEKMYQDVLKEFGKNPKAKILRMSSRDASNEFEDNSIDFLHIDANHEYKYIAEDLKLWYPKVRVGGFFSGHDYHQGFGVIKAVDEFVADNNKELHITEETNIFPSWWIIK